MQTEIFAAEQLKNVLISYWQKWAPTVNFHFKEDGEEDFSAGGYCNYTKTVTVRYLPLLKLYKQMKEKLTPITLSEFALIILAHEIGHYKDPKNLSLHPTNENLFSKATKLERIPENEDLYNHYMFTHLKEQILIEVRAWQIGRRLVKEHVSKHAFYLLMRYCLQQYLEIYKSKFAFEKKRFYASKAHKFI